MRKGIQQISIDTPCHQKWSDMLPADQGRYCESCSKNVTDFAGFTNEQILQLIASSGKICGKLDATQMKRFNLFLTEKKSASLSFKKLGLFLALALAGATKAEAKIKIKVEQAADKQKAQQNNIADTIAYRIITGTVTSNSDKLPLPGAVVKVPGTTIGTQADINGKFQLRIAHNVMQLQVSFIGYESQMVSVSDLIANNLSLSLALNETMLGELVILKKTTFIKRTWRLITRPFTSKY
jgi:hypothetical protein